MTLIQAPDSNRRSRRKSRRGRPASGAVTRSSVDLEKVTERIYQKLRDTLQLENERTGRFS
jgi:hypothetical protein